MAKGDHIKVKRKGYYHHGIHVGKKRVIHFTGEPGQKPGAEIKETSPEDFLLGGKLEIVSYSNCLPIEETLNIAKSFVGAKGYNLIFNNCEHFARYCKTTKKNSEQVDVGVANTAKVGSGILAAGSLTLVSSAGSVSGLSGAGIMSGLAALGPGGVIGGIITLVAVPSILSNISVSKTLKDYKYLSQEERSSRKVGRTAAKVGTAVGTIGTVGSISALGAGAGLSGAGITSGLATIGGFVNGGMFVGVGLSIAAPAVAAAVSGFGLYKIAKWFKKNKEKKLMGDGYRKNNNV